MKTGASPRGSTPPKKENLVNKLDVLARINPQMKAVLAKEDSLAGDANDTSVGFDIMRENYVLGRSFWVEGGPVMKLTFDETFDGPHGSLPVRFYYPTDEAVSGKESATEKTPCIVYVHGGGFCLGNLDTHDRICRILAQNTGAIVVAVDYHLSPEAKFPSAVEEVAFVARFIHENGARYGIDTERLGFAGDSGGAHLNLAATFYLRDTTTSIDYIKCLLLYYGWFGLQDSSSMRLLGGPWDGLAEADWLFYQQLYANDLEELKTSPYANLFLNDMTHDMPACYIAAAEYDPLKDDSSTLAAICDQYVIPYRYEIFEGVIHAFLHYTKALDAANDALEHGATFFKEQVGITEPGLL